MKFDVTCKTERKAFVTKSYSTDKLVYVFHDKNMIKENW